MRPLPSLVISMLLKNTASKNMPSTSSIQEVRIAFGKLTQKWLSNEMGTNQDNFNTIAATLEEGNVEEFYESHQTQRIPISLFDDRLAE